jgi:hypothetical protein
MTEQTITTGGTVSKLEKITLRKEYDEDILSIDIIRMDDDENVIEFTKRVSADGSTAELLNMYIGDNDLILFMRNIEYFISRNCCRNPLPDFPEE